MREMFPGLLKRQSGDCQILYGSALPVPHGRKTTDKSKFCLILFASTAGQSGQLIIKTTSVSADFRDSLNGLPLFENASPSTVSGNSYSSGTIGLA